MSEELSIPALEAEVEEMSKDLAAFLAARDIVRARVVEVKDRPRVLTPLANWAGTDAVLGSLDLSINAMTRTIEELKQVIKAQQHGRKFRVVDGRPSGNEG